MVFIFNGFNVMADWPYPLLFQHTAHLSDVEVKDKMARRDTNECKGAKFINATQHSISNLLVMWKQ